MTAVLASIGLWGWVCIVLGSSLIFALLVGRAIGLADDTQRAQYPPPVKPSLYRIPREFFPPVPPPGRVLDDWFHLVPAECLSDDEIRPLFDDIVAGEFA